MAEFVWIAHESWGAITSTHINGTASCASPTSSCMVLSRRNSVTLNYTAQTNKTFRARFKSTKCLCHLLLRLSSSGILLLTVVIKIVKQKTSFRLHLFCQELLNLLLLTYRYLESTTVDYRVGSCCRGSKRSIVIVLRTIFKLWTIISYFIFYLFFPIHN